jgi:Flp pilus assembly secretin CpaC
MRQILNIVSSAVHLTSATKDAASIPRLTVGSPISFMFRREFAVRRLNMASYKSFLLPVAVFAASACIFPAQAADSIQVMMNEARILKLARPADTIVVGNPAIADASVQDASTIVLTGKGFGVTNIVVLDKEGSPIIDEQVAVSRQDASTIRIYRRSEVQTMSCTPYCESAYKSAAEKTSEAEMSSGTPQ